MNIIKPIYTRNHKRLKLLFYLFHGFVFALGSALILYCTIVDVNIFVPPTDILAPTIVSLLLFFLFVLIAFLFSHDLETSGLIASLLILGFLFNWLIFLVTIIATIISVLSIKMIFKKVRLESVHLSLNAISIAIVGYFLIRFITLIGSEPWAAYPITIHPINDIPLTLATTETRPDVYYIILDGYGQADMLQEVHGFDNFEFVNELENRGFTVASQSQSNYPRTLLSLASSLNMQYLDTMSSAMGDSNLWWPVEGAVQHSEVRNILQNWGYKTVFFANDSDYSDIRDGDFYEAPFPIQLNIFNSRFLDLTNLKLLNSIDQLGIGDASYDTHRRIILYNFEKLPEIAKIPGAKFVFTHIIAPHPPYVFDREGNPLDPVYPFTLNDQMTSNLIESRNSYMDQLLFINQEILSTIDGILANSGTPPVIVIQADHGTGFFTDFDSLENSCMYERFSILNAYYLPFVDQDSIPTDLSPVNSFRFIFNAYFNTSLELLPNREYFSTSAHFYEFTDVSDLTHEHCNINPTGIP